MMTQSTKQHLTYTKEPVTKIGETGDTVVYIFPGGKACVKKGDKSSQGVSAASKSSVPNVSGPMTKEEKSVSRVQKFVRNANQQASKSKVYASAPRSKAQNIGKELVGDRLVRAGIINATQLQVALYDQKTMNLGFGDVLIARGWIDQATLDSMLGKAS